ncbi:unnamed protein product [Citrullus colocynthis]|uniref:Uncharacterized protein n=1 Tax=Citrullus colocynthis TaxID=252529 RepID=A0ABP0XWV9_9ROSI
MASQKRIIGKVLMFVLLLILLATNVIAKRNLLAAPNGEKMGIIKGEKVKMKEPDRPWEPGTGG